MKPGPRIVENALWSVAAVSFFWAGLWVLGVNGFGRIGWGNLPGWLDPVSMYGAHGQWTANPSTPVRVEPSAMDEILRAYQGASDLPDGHGLAPAHWGELLPGASRLQLWDPGFWQAAAYLTLQVAGYLAVAFIAITLARLVADSRGESPFRLRNVVRLQRIGLLLLVGAPVASLASWACLRWMVESSSMGDRVAVYDYRLSSVPLWTMLVGAAVLVLADVWKRGVQMADDVRGLV